MRRKESQKRFSFADFLKFVRGQGALQCPDPTCDVFFPNAFGLPNHVTLFCHVSEKRSTSSSFELFNLGPSMWDRLVDSLSKKGEEDQTLRIFRNSGRIWSKLKKLGFLWGGTGNGEGCHGQVLDLKKL